MLGRRAADPGAARRRAGLEVLVGGDDWALEGFCAGATGWVTGVADVAPRECVALYDACRAGELETARAIYARLLPLARFDMTPKLVQYFKAAMDEVGLAGGPTPRRRGCRSPTTSARRCWTRWRCCARAPYDATFAAVDSHTEGMPTRVVTGGVDPIPGATMLERKLHFEAEMDDLRLLLMREPRGHSAMSGAILQPPTRDDADWGVLFIEVSGLPADVRARDDRRRDRAGGDRHGRGARAGDRRAARHAGRAGRGARGGRRTGARAR